MKGRVNAEWHGEHRMPGNPTREQRVKWHSEHAAACGCRPVPAGLKAEVRELQAKTRAAA